jgi:hypothetical protein
MEFSCPRCGLPATEEFYGPCDTCRSALRASGGVAREIVVHAYEPKMNVVPNQVATKD